MNKDKAFCKHGYHINICCIQCENEQKISVDEELDIALWSALRDSSQLKSRGRLIQPKKK